MRTLLCRLGLHQWHVIRVISKFFLQCEAEDETRKREGQAFALHDDYVWDRFCIHCKKKDFRIEATYQRLLEKERKIVAVIKEIGE